MSWSSKPTWGRGTVLEVTDLRVSYGGEVTALHGVSLSVRAGEAVALVGANGAGKTTLLKALAGLLDAAGGEIRWAGRSITRLPAHERVKLGLALVPEGRRLFSRLRVRENLLLGTYTNRDRLHRARRLEFVLSLFPILGERAEQRAGTLSGGQQQMLAIGRALMLDPTMLMLDEPSLGLSPVLVDQIIEVLGRLHREQGMTILLVEQNVPAALDVCERGYVLQTGRMVSHGTGGELLATDLIRRSYLGI
ncbi:MAG TPA: ABC transporter ATP-binding protein [bacterium]|nr:ABC transporter ATP-binding protein [bacterium]